MSETKGLSKPSKKWIAIALAVIVCLVSIFGLSQVKMTGEKARVEKLQDVNTNFLTISAIAATAIAAVPDDATTPVADQVAGLSQYILVSNVALLIEQYILTVAPTVSFMVLIPIAIVLALAAYLNGKRDLWKFFIRVFSLALCLLMIVPVSLLMNDSLDATLGTNKTIVNIIKEYGGDPDAPTDENAENEEQKNVFQKVGDFFTNLFDTVKNAAQKAQEILMRMWKGAIAIVLTSLVVPVITLLVMWIIIKWALQGLVLSTMNSGFFTNKDLTGPAENV